MADIERPVNVSPVQAIFPIVDPATGKATETFQYFLLRVWEKLGGFEDPIFDIITITNLGQISGLVASGQAEALARQLNDAALQGRVNDIENVAAKVNAMMRQLGSLQALTAASLSGNPRTRVITFSDSDIYRIGSDVRSIDVFVLGGGGGGGAGGGIEGGGLGTPGGGAGGGSAWSFASLSADGLTSPISVTVGFGGGGGAGALGLPGSNGADGTYSSFGDIVFASGGLGGSGGAEGISPSLAGAGGNVGLFFGGSGAEADIVGGLPALNNAQGSPGGGGGGGIDAGPIAYQGGAGGASRWRSLDPDGGGAAGGLPGSGSGSPGGTGIDELLQGPGLGGGGGGAGRTATGGSGGAGGPGAGGGGGGAGVTGGNGGNGGAGRVWVVEHL